MLITDLPYIETTDQENECLGGSTLVVEAKASARGFNTLAGTSTDTKAISIADGQGAIATGKGSALAIGRFTYADTDYYAEGFDIVKVNEINIEGKRVEYEKVRVIAIDFPN